MKPNFQCRYFGRNQTQIDGVNVFEDFTGYLKHRLNEDFPMQFIWEEGIGDTGGYRLLIHFINRDIHAAINEAWDNTEASFRGSRNNVEA